MKSIFGSLWILGVSAAAMLGAADRADLTLYCAAGIQPPVQELLAKFEKECGIQVRVQYGGSGQLLSALQLARRGDLFLTGDTSYLEDGRKKGLVQEVIPLAHLTPVILLPRGNPKGIRSLADLSRPEIRVALANPDQTAIGKALRRRLGQAGLWDPLAKRAAVFKPTVNELANDVKLGSADAAIVWDATAAQYPGLTFLRQPILDEIKDQVAVGVLSYSQQAAAALRLARYLAARDRGAEIFKKCGYQALAGDAWEPAPEILFYSGALNRPAVDETLNRFEAREGCRIKRVYNGCGILVAQMKTGQRPDAYLACDVTFVTPVAERFGPATPISATDIILAVPKGNPGKLGGLADLPREGLRVGVANAEQSTLGALTRTLLEKHQLLPQTMRNVRAQTPTADMLVNQLLLGSLDVVVVYEANLAQVKDKLDLVRLESARAVQPFAVGRNSEHQQLAGRLLEAILDKPSKAHYQELGFHWLASPAR
jgi:molybdate transport system substrate-binding protein